MFERRLKVFLLVFALAMLVIVARLFQLQIVNGAYYRQRTARTLLSAPDTLPFIRGAILDREGNVLVADVATWQIAADYPALALDDAHINNYVRRFQRRGRYKRIATTKEEITSAFLEDVNRTWEKLAEFESAMGNYVSVDDIKERSNAIVSRTQRIRKIVEDNRGFDAPIREEGLPHGLVHNLTQPQSIEAFEKFRSLPWVHVQPTTRRMYLSDVKPFAHLLGRMGRVDGHDIATDPNTNDHFARYLGNERKGKTGIEYVAERRLRGRRGQMILDNGGEIVEEEYVEPLDGEDVTLTISGDLQRRLYDLLAHEIPYVPESVGGAIVVVDVPTREVLAMVSYPSYDPATFNENYNKLRNDTIHLPLHFRAVMSTYAPGSTVKPLVCLAGLQAGAINLNSTINCTGYLFKEQRKRWRCWQISGSTQRMAHGPINVTEAIRGSCNIFMYELGNRLGVGPITNYFDMFGLGNYSGVGLREERSGRNPTPSWLVHERNQAITPGKARHLAIGQAEVIATPVQIANIMATYANGKKRLLTLTRNNKPKAEWDLPGNASHWQAIRQGMFEVVNHPEGTAYKYVSFDHDKYVLCGKTGSATTKPRATSYLVPFEDKSGITYEVVVPAGAKSEAVNRFVAAYPDAIFNPQHVTRHTTWPKVPMENGDYAHAWFGGFIQPTKTPGQPDWSQTPQIAFAVLIEYGGSGGRTSGPVAGEVAKTIIEVFGDDLSY